jgi:hypothetical protein
LPGGVSGHRNERVITTALRMDDSHTARGARLRTAASSSFEDDNGGLGEPTRCHRSSNSFHEHSGCSRSIAPPPRRPRADHIRRIDEKHDLSLTEPAVIGTLYATDLFS